MVGICLLTQPELVVGAVVIVGVVVVAAAIQAELEDHAWRRGAHPEEGDSGEVESTEPSTQPAEQEPLASRRPQPEGLGRDWFPPEPPERPDRRERRPECTPKRVPPKGGHPFHNTCADNVPFNAFRGANALVNGKAFDALQPAARTLWEVKTDNFDTYTTALRRIVIDSQVEKLRLERELARACGFDFRVGVRSSMHKAELESEAADLEGIIVIMDWC